MVDFLKHETSNRDPGWVYQAVDVSSADYTPKGGRFRALVASVAGKITIVDGAGTTIQVYVNTGLNAYGGTTVKTGGSGDTATIIAAVLEN